MNFRLLGPILVPLTTYYSTNIDALKVEQFDKGIIIDFSLLYYTSS